MLHVISDHDLRFIEQAIVAAAREATTLRGDRVMVPTIDAKKLRQAAKLAISMAISEDVWDGSEVLKVPAAQRVRGYVEVEG
jgi:hypothetical protein